MRSGLRGWGSGGSGGSRGRKSIKTAGDKLLQEKSASCGHS